jgi:hypothetical protein
MNTSVMNLSQQQSASARRFSLLSQSITLRTGRRHSVLAVQKGCVWVTLPGTGSEDPQDLWLSAGQTLRLAPHQTLWVDGWPEADLLLQPWRQPAEDGLLSRLWALARPGRWARRDAWLPPAAPRREQQPHAGSCCSA